MAAKKHPSSQSRIRVWHKVRQSPRFNLYIVGLVIIALALAGYYAYRSRAAFGPGRVAATSLSLSGGAKTVTDSSATSGSVVQFATASPNPYPDPYSYPTVLPDASNTGQIGTNLPLYTGPETITQDGTVIDGKTINNDFDIDADNVTIKNSLIHGNLTDGHIIHVLANSAHHHGVVVDNNIIDPGVWHGGSAIVGIGITATRNNIANVTDGFDPDGNDIIVGNYVHDLDETPPDCPSGCDGVHSDAIQLTGSVNYPGTSTGEPGNVKILGNNLVGGNNSTIYPEPGVNNMAQPNLIIQGNYLNGIDITETNSAGVWHYSTNLLFFGTCPGCLSGLKIDNNVFGRVGDNTIAGDVAMMSADLASWTNNRYDSPSGTIIPKP